MSVIEFILILVSGVLIGVGVTLIVVRAKTKVDGDLRIFIDPDDGPYQVAVYKDTHDINAVMQKKYVIFNVKVNPVDNPYSQN